MQKYAITFYARPCGMLGIYCLSEVVFADDEQKAKDVIQSKYPKAFIYYITKLDLE